MKIQSNIQAEIFQKNLEPQDLEIMGNTIFIQNEALYNPAKDYISLTNKNIKHYYKIYVKFLTYCFMKNGRFNVHNTEYQIFIISSSDQNDSHTYHHLQQNF